MNDRVRLSHVLWIGGSPHAGKTTLSRLLAGKYDLKIYNLDWHHVREHRSRPGGTPAGWDDLSMDERWLLPTPGAMAERDIASWTAMFPLVVEDLLALSTNRLVVAEGPGAFPWCVERVIQSPTQAIFLLPTPDLSDAILRRRGGSAAMTSDPERARRNILARNAIIAARIAASCDELDLRHERVDGSRSLDELIALLEEHFRPHLPKVFNV